MIIGAIIAAVLWLLTLVYSAVTIKPWEYVSPGLSVFSLLVMEVCGVTIGAIVQLIQGTL